MKIRVAFSGFLIIFSACLLGTGCNRRTSENKTKVHLLIKTALHKKIVIEQVGVLDEKDLLVASFSNNQKDIIDAGFTLNKKEERLFRISCPDYRDFTLFFIDDAPEINIVADVLSNKLLSVEGSKATKTFHSFIQKRDSINHLSEILEKQHKLANNAYLPQKKLDSLKELINKNIQDSFSLVNKFADTTSSAGIFVGLFNSVDFGYDRLAMKSFMIRASKRFPDNSLVQKLKDETLEYLSIFEKEYNIGDTIPSISLPSQNEPLFSTESLKGKYYFLDIWSTWCDKCEEINRQKSIVNQLYPRDKFVIVSIAWDDDKKTWENVIHNENQNWIQLIDVKLWRGSSVKALKFDSIPFNYLVSPEGIIIDKAIPVNSIVKTIKKALGNQGIFPSKKSVTFK
jgi:thiol-disulfide isomerase/thioredoxin